MESRKHRAILLFAVVAFGPGAVDRALAQGPPAGALEEVLVTGSRLRTPNVTSSSQIVTVEVEDISDRGITRVEDYLNDLPQISPGQTITASNGASGTATVNVRNLGCERTLVLINGQRLAPGTTGGGNCADLNSIPTLLLERVEVLTGGASSVYGSDAVGGVVNFILDNDFEGFKANYMHSFYQHNNDNGAFARPRELARLPVGGRRRDHRGNRQARGRLRRLDLRRARTHHRLHRKNRYLPDPAGGLRHIRVRPDRRHERLRRLVDHTSGPVVGFRPLRRSRLHECRGPIDHRARSETARRRIRAT